MAHKKLNRYNSAGLMAFYRFLIETINDTEFPVEFKLQQVQSFCDYFRGYNFNYGELAEMFKSMHPYNALFAGRGSRLSSRDFKVLQQLAKNGISPNVNYEGQGEPLWTAVGLVDPRSVQVLLSAGAHPNSKNHRNISILGSALERGNGKVVNLLLMHGADPNGISALELDGEEPEGGTPLEYLQVKYLVEGTQMLNDPSQGSHAKLKKEIWDMAKALQRYGAAAPDPARQTKLMGDIRVYAPFAIHEKCEKAWGELIEGMRKKESAKVAMGGRNR